MATRANTLFWYDENKARITITLHATNIFFIQVTERTPMDRRLYNSLELARFTLHNIDLYSPPVEHSFYSQEY
jgi:hypothetical protein